MEVDRAGAEEELGGHLAVGQPLTHEGSDLQLLRGERRRGGHVPLAGALARRAQLRDGPLDPGGRSEVLERGQRRPQLLPGVHPAPGPSQVLAVGEPGARLGDDPLAALLGRHRLGEHLDGGLLRERGELVLRPGHSEHTGAAAGQRKRRRATDSASGAGDDRDPSLHAGTLAPARRPRQRGRICSCQEIRPRW